MTHGQQLERGAVTLERAFVMDPRWQMALHHALEFRLSRGETAPLAPIVAQLRTRDPGASAALACQIAIADRQPAKAVTVAREALAQTEPTPELYVCLLQAQILAGDLDAAEQTSKLVLDRWPIDLREWGGRAIANELLLYRGRLADYLGTVGVLDRQRIITLAVWRPSVELIEIPQIADGARGQPIVPASQTLVQHALDKDPLVIYAEAVEAELRSYGRGLASELHGEPAAAITEYRKALDAPSKGDTRMLIAYQLAKVLVQTGDTAGAKAACMDVIAPRVYQPYRAALLPDCLVWSGEHAQLEQLARAWTGELAHPAVTEARRLLEPR